MRLRSALRHIGLRWRLTGWVAGVMLIAAAAIFLIVYNRVGSELSAQINRDLAGDTTQLSQALHATPGSGVGGLAAQARSYIRSQPYTATSTLLFIHIPGRAVVSNHPEVFGAPTAEPGETERDQAAENAAGRRLLTFSAGYSTVRVPDVGEMRIHERVRGVGSIRAVVGAAEPLALVEQAQHGVARAFLLAGTLILALALLASYLAGARVSAPLRRMAAVAARIDAGDLGPRMDLSGHPPGEVLVLGTAFNRMLERLAESFRGQRQFIADASHELRTPLTVIRGQLEVLVSQAAPSPQDVQRVERMVQIELARINRLVDDLLLLAKSEQPHFLRVEPLDVASFITELWRGLTPTARRRFKLGPLAHGVLLADSDRLAQALRNLIRNAIEQTEPDTGRVCLEARPVGAGSIQFAVTDNGPGIPESERERVFERFHRTDASRSRSTGGAGLGLAIVAAIAQAHHGTVRAAAGDGSGGARFELELPRFTPFPSPTATIQQPATKTRT